MKTETIQEMAGMQDGAIVSKVLTQNGSTTLFALAQGEEIQEHTSTRAALAIVLEGRIIFTVDGEEKEIQGMEAVHLPASVVHALRADTNSRMLLIQKGEREYGRNVLLSVPGNDERDGMYRTGHVREKCSVRQSAGCLDTGKSVCRII